jgi:hypothetical protein
MRSQQSGGPSRGRANRAQHMQIIVLRLLDRPRTRSDRRPHARQRTLLAESRFVLKPDLDAFARMRGGDLPDQFRGVFLKASTAAGSASLCWGRGTRSL